jgi:sporulation related protein
MADRYQDRPFPADGNYRGGRQAPSKGENDPLAELARLIGQTDPFAGFGRANQSVQPRGNPRDPLPPQPAPEAEAGPASQPSWMQRAAAQQPPQQQDFDAGRPPPAPRFAAPPVAEPNFAAPPPFAAAPQLPQQGFDTGRPAPAQRYAPPHAAEPDYQAQPQPFTVPPDEDEQLQNGPGRYDDALYGQLPRASGGLPQDSGYDDPYAYQDDYGEGTGDQGLRPRRGGISTVAAVVALAVVGTGAAFAYRAYVASPRSGEPPIIRADAGPNRMLPPTQSGDTTGKLIQDRMTGSATERMVSREEQPMDLKDGQSGPRVIFPPLNQNANPPPAASVAPSNRPMSNAGMGGNAGGMGNAGAGNAGMASAGNGNLAGDEPRKIRTLSVRGDQADAAAAAKPASVATMRSAAPAAATKNPPPAAANANASAAAPMAITPQAATPAATRMATINTPQPVTPAAAATSSGGNYMVQVASQRNEADAQASYKSLQGKYPAVLGSREPLIKRADLGDKGIYFRAMVGPFGSPNEATQFCAGLKTAGGQCVVQRN